LVRQKTQQKRKGAAFLLHISSAKEG